MKKILISLTSAMVLLGSTSYAQSIAQQDAELLFGNNAQTMQVATLDKSEMAKTEGEGIWGAWIGAVAYGGYLWYTGKSFNWSDFGGATAAGFVLFPW